MPIYKKVNKDFFKKWTKEMAYVLGFFAADGYMTSNNKGGGYINIEIVDKNLLILIRKIIGSTHKISRRSRIRGNKSVSYRLQIGNKTMFEDLYNLGMRENKTYRLALPKIPDQYLPDFVRGYFDGDGHVWIGIINKERKTPHFVIQTVFTSCSKSFLEDLSGVLGNMGIDRGRVSKGKGNYHRLTYSIVGSLKLYDFMYNESYKLFLSRKKVVFESFIKSRKMRA